MTVQTGYTLTTQNFVQPAIGNSVDIQVQSSNWMVGTQIVYIDNAGYFEVSSVPDSTDAVLINLGYAGNATPGTTIAFPVGVGPGGIQGATGPTGPSGGPTGPTGATGPNGVLDAFTFANSGVTMTSSYQTITTIGATATSDGKLVIHAGSTFTVSTFGSGEMFVQYQIAIDGTPLFSGASDNFIIVSGASNYGAVYARTVLATGLSAGSHTITLRALASGNGGATVRTGGVGYPDILVAYSA